EIIQIKLGQIKEIVIQQYNTDENKKANRITLILTNEDHTVGQLLNKVLQEHPNVLFSGVAMKDNLVKEILFKIVTKEINMIETVFECIDYLVELFNKMKAMFAKK